MSNPGSGTPEDEKAVGSGSRREEAMDSVTLLRTRLRGALYSVENFKPISIKIGTLKEKGWELWSSNLINAWQEHAIDDVGMGTYKQPNITSKSTEAEIQDVMQWRLMNTRAMTILKQGITLDHNHLIDGLGTAAEMYSVLEAHFAKDAELTPATSLTALANHRWDKSSSTSDENLSYIQGHINLIRCFKGDFQAYVDLMHCAMILNSLPEEDQILKATLYSKKNRGISPKG